MPGFDFLGFIPFDNRIIEADLEGRPPFETNPEGLNLAKEMILRLSVE
jgi:CO dehydrogenase maturation factor